jgi:hypothetical protein
MRVNESLSDVETQPRLCSRMQNRIVSSFSLRQASNLNCICADLE